MKEESRVHCVSRISHEPVYALVESTSLGLLLLKKINWWVHTAFSCGIIILPNHCFLFGFRSWPIHHQWVSAVYTTTTAQQILASIPRRESYYHNPWPTTFKMSLIISWKWTLGMLSQNNCVRNLHVIEDIICWIESRQIVNFETSHCKALDAHSHAAFC